MHFSSSPEVSEVQGKKDEEMYNTASVLIKAENAFKWSNLFCNEEMILSKNLICPQTFKLIQPQWIPYLQLCRIRAFQ